MLQYDYSYFVAGGPKVCIKTIKQLHYTHADDNSSGYSSVVRAEQYVLGSTLSLRKHTFYIFFGDLSNGRARVQAELTGGAKLGPSETTVRLTTTVKHSRENQPDSRANHR